MTSQPDDPRLAFLAEAGAATTAHSRRTLLQHLKGVSDLLAAWGSRRALVDAGLFHSVYGTEFYRPMIVGAAERARVRDIIGAEAERLAYLWCRIRRASLAANSGEGEFVILARGDADEDDFEIPVEEDDVNDLATLWAADTLEQVDRLGGRTRHQAELYSLRDRVPKRARQALERVFSERPFARA